MTELRVIDVGTVDAIRSQSLWHGIASAMTEETPPTLSFCRSADAYVGIGYHRSLDELDLTACAHHGLPVIRRRIGGGPVYLDEDQLCFQLTVPATLAPPVVEQLYARFLGPAVDAFRELGLDAELLGLNDIVVDDRKISGTGAGRIGDGVTVVGNVIFRFPRRRMAAVLALPNSARAECEILMGRYVSSLADEGHHGIDGDRAREALIGAYARSLELTPEVSETTAAEDEAIADWDTRLASPEWLDGRPANRGPGAVRAIKIHSAVWLLAATGSNFEAQATIVRERFSRAVVSSPRLNGEGIAMSLALAGSPANKTEIFTTLAPFGDLGRRVAELLAPGLPPDRLGRLRARPTKGSS